MVFPIAMDGCESWTIKKAEHQRIHVFKLQCWRILLKVPWTARRSNQPILKDINPEYSLEGLMLKLKLQYLGHLIWRAIGKDPDAGKKHMKSHWKRSWCWERLRAGGEGEDRRQDVGWHHQLIGNEIKQIPGASGGQRSLMCCRPWGCKESDTTEWLNNNKLFKVNIIKFHGKSGLRANSRKRVQVLKIKRKSTEDGLILKWEVRLDKKAKSNYISLKKPHFRGLSWRSIG